MGGRQSGALELGGSEPATGKLRGRTGKGDHAGGDAIFGIGVDQSSEGLCSRWNFMVGGKKEETAPTIGRMLASEPNGRAPSNEKENLAQENGFRARGCAVG